ncbi:TPA: hypothetical protein ACRZGX_003450 [Escherichia coli]
MRKIKNAGCLGKNRGGWRKINLLMIQGDRTRLRDQLAFISREIVRYFWQFSKSTPSLSGKVIRHVWGVECCALSLTKDTNLLYTMSYFVKIKCDNENYYRSIFYDQAFFNPYSHSKQGVIKSVYVSSTVASLA